MLILVDPLNFQVIQTKKTLRSSYEYLMPPQHKKIFHLGGQPFGGAPPSKAS